MLLRVLRAYSEILGFGSAQMVASVGFGVQQFKRDGLGFLEFHT